MSAFITINKLFEKLPESELKAVQVYFDDYITDRYYNNKINVKILFLSLVYKNNTQKVMNYKEFRELIPNCEWLTIPKRSFSQQTLMNYLKNVTLMMMKLTLMIFKNHKIYFLYK